jgi:hypothetical protein
MHSLKFERQERQGSVKKGQRKKKKKGQQKRNSKFCKTGLRAVGAARAEHASCILKRSPHYSWLSFSLALSRRQMTGGQLSSSTADISPADYLRLIYSTVVVFCCAAEPCRQFKSNKQIYGTAV